jgi:hypothetical protein
MRSVFYDKNTTTESFWSGMYKHSETYKELAVVAILILSIFPTTVMCEVIRALHFIRTNTESNLLTTTGYIETCTGGEKCDRISFRKSPVNLR